MNEEIDFRITFKELEEEYLKALIDHSKGRYSGHEAKLVLDLSSGGNGTTWLTFECEAKTDSVAMDYECEFGWIIFTNDKDWNEQFIEKEE